MSKESKKADKSAVFAFRTSNKATINGLAEIKSNSDFISEIMELYFTGKLIPLDEAIKKIEMQEMKYRKLKAKTIQDELVTKLQLMRVGKATPDEVNDIMNNKKNIMNLHQSNEIIQPDKTLRCVTCGNLFDMRGYDFQQVDDYEKHVKNIHGRELYENERNQMLIVLGEVTTS